MIRSQRAGVGHQGGIGIDVFSPDEMQAIHWGTVEVLEKAGLWVEDDEAIDLFADGGCKVDRSTRKVKIPQHVLEEAISWAPSKVVLCGRTPDKDVVLEGRRVTYTNFAEGVKAVDPWDGKLRPTTKKDVGDLARLVDALDDIEVYTIAVTATDVAPEVAEAHLIEATLNEHHEADLQPGARPPRRPAPHRRRGRRRRRSRQAGRAAHARVPELPGEPSQADG